MSSEMAVSDSTLAAKWPAAEFVNAVTHGAGILLSLAGGIPLLIVAVTRSDALCAIGCSFYTAALLAVYAASTLSHLNFSDDLRRWWRSVDQGCIYLLIVGTFTPFALTLLTSPVWLCFYALIMALGVGGFLSKVIFAHRLEQTCVWLYLVLAWGEAIAFVPMQESIPPTTTSWIIAGGVCYTVGTIFWRWDLHRYHFHAIWHVLVIAGSICHYVAVLQLVAARS